MVECLAIIGSTTIALILLIIVWKLLKGLWTCGLGYAFGWGVKWHPAPDGVWAVVTGGTDGMGLEYVKQFANKGYSILILSRSEEKLKRVAEDIKRQYPKCTEVKTFAVDFQRTDIYSGIAEVINSLTKIDVLVNNVGIMYNTTEYFLNVPSQYNHAYINVNIVSHIKMCEMILPKMVNEKRGIIINISSTAALSPRPMFTVYSATKAFTDFFSRGLAIEYAQKGITIQTVLPGQVITNLTPKDIGNVLPVTAEQFVSAAIKTVGIEWRTFGHWKHKLFAFISGSMTMIFGSKFVTSLTMKTLEKRHNEFIKNRTKDT